MEPKIRSLATPMKESHDDVLVFLDAYQHAFASFEPERIASFYSAPCLSVSRTELTAYPTAGDVLENFVAVTAKFRESGLSGFRYELLDVRRYRPELLDIRVRWTLRFSTLPDEHRLDNVYTLRVINGVPTIVSVLLAA